MFSYTEVSSWFMPKITKLRLHHFVKVMQKKNCGFCFFSDTAGVQGVLKQRL